jgi:hypothetical protein
MAYKVNFFISYLLFIYLLSFRLGATLPSKKSHASSESAKMDVDDEENASASSKPSSTQHQEPPKVESDPESDLGS